MRVVGNIHVGRPYFSWGGNVAFGGGGVQVPQDFHEESMSSLVVVPLSQYLFSIPDGSHARTTQVAPPVRDW